jgi:hypothetical protein
MRYHDFHLREYRVTDFGTRISLHLVYDYEGRPTEESEIEFSDVMLYNFTHTSGAIITDIEESSVGDVLGEVRESLPEWNRQHGIARWRDTLENYQAALESTSHKAWRISSAIGFYGFVVARSVRQVAPNISLERTRDR